MKTHQWTLGRRMWTVNAAALFSLTLLGGFSVYFSQRLAVQLKFVSNTEVPAVRNMTMMDMMHDGIRANVFHSVIASGSKNAKEIGDIRAETLEFSKNIREYLEALQRLDLSTETRKAIEPQRKEVDEYAKAGAELAGLALDGKLDAAMAGIPAFQERFEKLEKSLGTLGKLIEEESSRIDQDGESLASRASLFSLFVFLFGFVFQTVAAFVTIKMTKNKLSDISGALSHESVQVNDSATTLAEAARNLGTISNEQAAAIQETAAAVDEITAIAAKNRDHVAELKQDADSSREVAIQGQTSIEQMVSAMGTIRENNTHVMQQVEESNQKISEIVKVIGQISEKTKVINDIVFQTKLLSFNASVEAARAGEHGKGFAVVAEEVGNLAAMSGKAAQEISNMLQASISHVEEIVNESRHKVEVIIQEGKVKVDSGTQVAQQCGDVLSKIVEQNTRVGELVQTINGAFQEQASGLDEISKAIRSLDSTTQNNAALSRNTSNQSDALLGRSKELGFLISDLNQLASGEAVASMADGRTRHSTHGNAIDFASDTTQDHCGLEVASHRAA